MLSDVTAVIVNYNTPDLTRRSVESLRRFYPTLGLLIVDNGSDAATLEVLHALRDRHAATTRLHRNDRNLFHGPAMDQAIRMAGTAYAFVLDSDCELTRPGLLEELLRVASTDDRIYAIGHKIGMDGRGFDCPLTDEAIAYIRPYCMLLRKEIYCALPRFVHHGAPCLENMRAAVAQGYRLKDFPVLDFVIHEGRGTAGRFGYHLGLRGRLNHALHILGFGGKKVGPVR